MGDMRSTTVWVRTTSMRLDAAVLGRGILPNQYALHAWSSPLSRAYDTRTELRFSPHIRFTLPVVRYVYVVMSNTIHLRKYVQYTYMEFCILIRCPKNKPMRFKGWFKMRFFNTLSIHFEIFHHETTSLKLEAFDIIYQS